MNLIRSLHTQNESTEKCHFRRKQPTSREKKSTANQAHTLTQTPSHRTGARLRNMKKI